MTQLEHDTLVARHGAGPVEWMVQRLHDQIEGKGDKWKSHAAAIRSWVVDAYAEHLRKIGPDGTAGAGTTPWPPAPRPTPTPEQYDALRKII